MSIYHDLPFVVLINHNLTVHVLPGNDVNEQARWLKQQNSVSNCILVNYEFEKQSQGEWEWMSKSPN